MRKKIGVIFFLCANMYLLQAADAETHDGRAVSLLGESLYQFLYGDNVPEAERTAWNSFQEPVDSKPGELRRKIQKLQSQMATLEGLLIQQKKRNDALEKSQKSFISQLKAVKHLLAIHKSDAEKMKGTLQVLKDALTFEIAAMKQKNTALEEHIAKLKQPQAVVVPEKRTTYARVAVTKALNAAGIYTQGVAREVDRRTYGRVVITSAKNNLTT